LVWGNPTGTNWDHPTPFVQQVRTLPDGSLFAGEVVPFDWSADLVFPADFDGDGVADVISGWT